MSKQHPKSKPDPREERERHLHRIELYERRQREAAAAGKPVGIAGSLRAAVLAGVARVVRLFRRDVAARKPVAGASPRATQHKPPPRRPKPKPRRKR